MNGLEAGGLLLVGVKLMDEKSLHSAWSAAKSSLMSKHMAKVVKHHSFIVFNFVMLLTLAFIYILV